MFVTLVIVCIISVTFAGANQQWAFHTRAEPDEKCEKAFTLLWKGLEMMKSTRPREYQGAVYMAGMLLQVDLRNADTLKSRVCNITGVKNLRELHATLPFMGRTYEKAVTEYKNFQEKLGGIGGYTNIPRIWMLAQDLLKFIQGAPGVQPDLATLTRFFEVNQVKYGSRWLSLLAMSKNQMVLIEDPKVMAKKLHDCTSEDDVAKLLSIETKKAKPIYEFLLLRKSQRVKPSELELVDFAVQGVTLMGEMGLFNLQY